jgi:hypothetical protein
MAPDRVSKTGFVYIWITDPQRTDPKYMNDTKFVLQTTLNTTNQNPGLHNRPIKLVKFGRDQPIKCSDFFQIFRICPVLRSVIHI